MANPSIAIKCPRTSTNHSLDLLKEQLRRVDNPLHAMHLGACFCLFVSEQYRRNYNSSWSWSGAETELGISLTPQQHASLTNDGLAYWKRPIRFRDSGRDWLGSLFTEGGLPGRWCKASHMVSGGLYAGASSISTGPRATVGRLLT